MIRFAAPSDHPRLKALWADAFGDPPEALDAYFSHRQRDGNMLLDERDNTVTGMLTMLPVTLSSGGGQAYKGRYIFAVATDVHYRNLGVSTALLEAAHAHMKGLGEAAAVLAPATQTLFGFYGKRGYKTAFSIETLTVTAAELPPFPQRGRFTECSGADYTRLRDIAFHNSRLYVRWEESAVIFAVKTFVRAGGAAAISWEGGQGCAAWEQTKEGILVRELALVNGDVKTALAVLHRQLNARQYTVRLAEGTLSGVPAQPTGMIHWLIPEPALVGAPPYLALTKD
jgi:GNAT superfamily N-acetyltransferase